MTVEDSPKVSVTNHHEPNSKSPTVIKDPQLAMIKDPQLAMIKDPQLAIIKDPQLANDKDGNDTHTPFKLGKVKPDNVANEKPCDGDDDDDVKDNTEEDNSDDDGVPTDEGWSWVIVFCGFAGLTILAGYDFSIFFLFPDLVERFDSRVSVMTSMFSIQSICMSVGGVLNANVLMPRYSNRVIACTSALIHALTTLVMSQVTSVGPFLVLTGVKGIGNGVIGLCSMTMMGFYFKKRRAMASAIICVGICTSIMVFPTLAEVLRKYYGVSGCLIMISAIELHSVPLHMLLRPVSSYRKLHKAKHQTQQQLLSNNIDTELDKSKTDTSKESPSTYDLHDSSRPFSRQNSEHLENNGLSTKTRQSTHIFLRSVSESHSNDYDHIIHQNNRHRNESLGDSNSAMEKPSQSLKSESLLRSVLFQSVTDFDSKNEQTIHQIGAGYTVEPHRAGYTVEPHHKSPLSRSTSQPDESDLSLSQLLMTSSTHRMESPLPRRRSRSRHDSVSASVMGSVMELGPTILDTPEESRSDEGSRSEARGCGIRSFIDVSLFKSWLFNMMMLGSMFTVLSNFMSIYMPTKARLEGVSREETAILSTVQGATDLVCRLLVGYIADLGIVRKSLIVSLSFAVLGVTCQFSSFFNDFPSMMILALLLGIFGGARHNLQGPMLIDYLGVERMAKALSIQMIVLTVTMSYNHPLVGLLVEATGNFDIVYHYIGAWLLVSSAIFMCEPLFRRLDERNKKKNSRDAVKALGV